MRMQGTGVFQTSCKSKSCFPVGLGPQCLRSQPRAASAVVLPWGVEAAQAVDGQLAVRVLVGQQAERASQALLVRTYSEH